MDDSTKEGEKDNDRLQKIDLSALQNFNFASNWSEAPAAPVRRERDSAPRGGPRRERQPDRRPAGAKSFRSAPSEGRGDAGQPVSGGDRGPSARPERQSRPGRFQRREERPDLVLLRESPFDLQIFPEEPILAALTKAMRHSMRTYELFEVARLILEKADRFHLSIRFREGAGNDRSLFQSVPDGFPFVSEDAAVDHVFHSHLDKFFTVEEVETEQPKGSFQFIARCTLTGDFLSPPNYHRYQPILLQYYQERFADMPFERFRSHIETVKDEEAIQRWLLSMTKQNRYKLVVPEGAEEQIFETAEEARSYLLQHKKDQVVRAVKAVRVPGKRMEEIVASEIKPYLLAYVDNQRRFPLDTANSLRGRLRRQHFIIYKKGSRGVSLVCAIKRKHRQPGQIFSESIQNLIVFLEENDQIVASHLLEKFLGIPPTPEGEEASPHSPEVEEKLKRLNLDLRWLLSEGYVVEYSDGRLSAQSMAETHGVEKTPGEKQVKRSGPANEPKPVMKPAVEEEAVVENPEEKSGGSEPTGTVAVEEEMQPEEPVKKDFETDAGEEVEEKVPSPTAEPAASEEVVEPGEDSSGENAPSVAQTTAEPGPSTNRQ